MALLAAFAVLLVLGTVCAQYPGQQPQQQQFPGDNQFRPGQGSPAQFPQQQQQQQQPQRPNTQFPQRQNPQGGVFGGANNIRPCTEEEANSNWGYVADEQDCGGFWRCVGPNPPDNNYIARHFQCPAGQQFHHSRWICGEYPENCGNRRILN